MLRAEEFYCNLDDWIRSLVSVCDARDGKTIARFWSEHAGRQGSASIEVLDPDHLVLVVWPGAARGGER